MFISENVHFQNKCSFLGEHRRPSSITSEVSRHTHSYNPNHNITLENTKILSVEHKWFEREVKEAIHIRALNPSLNRDSGRYNLPSIWNNIIKKRLTENGAGAGFGVLCNQFEILSTLTFLFELLIYCSYFGNKSTILYPQIKKGTDFFIMIKFI